MSVVAHKWTCQTALAAVLSWTMGDSADVRWAAMETWSHAVTKSASVSR